MWISQDLQTGWNSYSKPVGLFEDASALRALRLAVALEGPRAEVVGKAPGAGLKEVVLLLGGRGVGVERRVPVAEPHKTTTLLSSKSGKFRWMC